MDERMGNMTRKKDTFDTQINPFGWKIRQGHAPILPTFINMRFVNEMVDAIPLSQKSLYGIGPCVQKGSLNSNGETEVGESRESQSQQR